MPGQGNKAVVRRYFAALSAGDVESLRSLVAEDFVDHSAAPDALPGLAGEQQFLAMVRRAFPDARWEIEDMLAEGDRVAVRVTFRGTQRGEFLGVPARGRAVAMPGIGIIRLSAGMLREAWIQRDRATLMRQLQGQ